MLTFTQTQFLLSQHYTSNTAKEGSCEVHIPYLYVGEDLRQLAQNKFLIHTSHGKDIALHN